MDRRLARSSCARDFNFSRLRQSPAAVFATFEGHNVRAATAAAKKNLSRNTLHVRKRCVYTPYIYIARRSVSETPFEVANTIVGEIEKLNY